MFEYINDLIKTWLRLVSFIKIDSSTSNDNLKYTQREGKNTIASQLV